ncbi:hypothetical protein PR048_029258 [Dryococelus australis]|uniref:Uncharacterized protein n=1 Tax=Dryococelus australis TaxID=614101 RepID=A0ABQ9GFN4_9NEOP|nr:hypothetical protein PR048_029258 [Dryococelus australis]
MTAPCATGRRKGQKSGNTGIVDDQIRSSIELSIQASAQTCVESYKESSVAAYRLDCKFAPLQTGMPRSQLVWQRSKGGGGAADPSAPPPPVDTPLVTVDIRTFLPGPPPVHNGSQSGIISTHTRGLDYEGGDICSRRVSRGVNSGHRRGANGDLGRGCGVRRVSSPLSLYFTIWRFGGHSGIVVRKLTSHIGEPDSIPGGVTPEFSHVSITPEDAAGRRVFPGISQVSARMARSVSWDGYKCLIGWLEVSAGTTARMCLLGWLDMSVGMAMSVCWDGYKCLIGWLEVSAGTTRSVC